MGVNLLFTLTLVCLSLQIFVVFAQSTTLDLYEDDVCHQDKGAVWTCKHHTKCPSKENPEKGVEPRICSFQDKEPIVCCEPEVKPSPSWGAKATAKCKEYAESVVILVPDTIAEREEEMRVDTCPVVEPLTRSRTEARPTEFPHMALIGFGPKEKISWACGGSLVSERFVIGAAHCSNNLRIGPAKWVRLGDYNIQSKDDDDQGLALSEEFEIIEIIKHPNYKEPSVYFDIALFKLDRDVTFNEFIRPICLQTNHQFQKTYALLTGWGRTSRDDKVSEILQLRNISVVQRKTCNELYKPLIGLKLKDGVQDQTQLCAGDSTNPGDICQGNSGGPLQVRLKEPYCMYALVGVTSLGGRCGAGLPDVYTRVSHFVPWIESVVWP